MFFSSLKRVVTKVFAAFKHWIEVVNNPLNLRIQAIITGIFFSLPYLVVIPLGFLWLWQNGYLVYWFIFGLLPSALSFGWMFYLRHHSKKRIRQYNAEFDGILSDKGKAAFARVQTIADNLDPNDYPYKPEAWFSLGKEVWTEVAKFYYPDSQKPIMEVPLPALIRVCELVLRDIRIEYVQKIPASHVFTLNTILNAKEISVEAKKIYNTTYRPISFLINPLNALLREVREFAYTPLTNYLAEEAKNQLLRTYVEKIGFHAICLYSGSILLTEFKQIQEDAIAEKNQLQVTEPLRILIIGQVKAGKSSLINALFGEMKAATSVLPLTYRLTPYTLERDGMGQMILFDSMGYEDQHDAKAYFASIQNELLRCDLILMVCGAHNAARKADKDFIQEINALFQKHLDTPKPPIIAVVSHIDKLRPVREWKPPYNIENTENNLKAQSIREAVEYVANSLQLNLSLVIPVNLQPDQLYNVEEGLIPAMLALLPEAKRVQYLRCLREQRNSEQWSMLWQQARVTGRVLINKIDSLWQNFDKYKNNKSK